MRTCLQRNRRAGMRRAQAKKKEAVRKERKTARGITAEKLKEMEIKKKDAESLLIREDSASFLTLPRFLILSDVFLTERVSYRLDSVRC